MPQTSQTADFVDDVTALNTGMAVTWLGTSSGKHFENNKSFFEFRLIAAVLKVINQPKLQTWLSSTQLMCYRKVFVKR